MHQWRSSGLWAEDRQPKILVGAKYSDFKPITVFGLGYRLSKYKTTKYAANLKGAIVLFATTWLRL